MGLAICFNNPQRYRQGRINKVSSGCPGSNPEWELIYYEASITAQGLPEPSSLRGSTLGTRAAEHKGCNWGMQID